MLGELFGDDLLHQGDCYQVTVARSPPVVVWA
jgi:hypothetical protein